MCKVQKLQFTIFISQAYILHSTLSLCTRKFEAGAGLETVNATIRLLHW